jgi:hypothetical protein
MAKGWPIIGGLMIVTTVTYLNLTAIKAIARDMRISLESERKKLEAARNLNRTLSDKPVPAPKRPIEERISDRMKKMWNSDIESTVRRMQKMDWERMGRSVGSHIVQAKERIAGSLERIAEEDAKKKSA